MSDIILLFYYFILPCSEWSPRSSRALCCRAGSAGSIIVFMPRILFVLFEPRLRYSRLTLNLLLSGDFCSPVSIPTGIIGVPPIVCVVPRSQSRAACSLAGSHPTHPGSHASFQRSQIAVNQELQSLRLRSVVFTVTKDMVPLGEMCHQEASS